MSNPIRDMSTKLGSHTVTVVLMCALCGLLGFALHMAVVRWSGSPAVVNSPVQRPPLPAAVVSHPPSGSVESPAVQNASVPPPRPEIRPLTESDLVADPRRAPYIPLNCFPTGAAQKLGEVPEFRLHVEYHPGLNRAPLDLYPGEWPLSEKDVAGIRNLLQDYYGRGVTAWRTVDLVVAFVVRRVKDGKDDGQDVIRMFAGELAALTLYRKSDPDKPYDIIRNPCATLPWRGSVTPAAIGKGNTP